MYVDSTVNIEGTGAGVDEFHSLTFSHQEFRSLKLKWVYLTKEFGEIEIQAETYNGIENFSLDTEKTRLSIGWKYYLN